MADIPDRLLPHRVDVEPFTGAGGYDDTYGPKVQAVHCLRDGNVQLTSDGQLVDAVTIYCRLQHAPILQPQSRVTWSYAGQLVSARVEVVQPRDDGGLGAWQHLEIVVR